MTLTVLSYANDGTVHVKIDAAEYVYFIDAAFISHFLRLTKKSDGAGLNFLKSKAYDYRRLKNDESEKIV